MNKTRAFIKTESKCPESKWKGKNTVNTQDKNFGDILFYIKMDRYYWIYLIIRPYLPGPREGEHTDLEVYKSYTNVQHDCFL